MQIHPVVGCVDPLQEANVALMSLFLFLIEAARFLVTLENSTQVKKRVPSASTEGGETAVQAVVGSIVWAFRRLKKPRSREMSARGYSLHSVCPQLPFFPQGR